MAGFVSLASAQQFTNVSTAVGLVAEAKKSWGNPIWGDMNNDGFIDLIVPTHGLASSGGPFVYLNNAGNTFTDIRATSGIKLGPEFDSKDWHGISFGDFNGDGNLDVYVAEGSKGGVAEKRDLLFSGHGDGTFTYASDTAGIETSLNRGRGGFFVDYDNDGQLDLFAKNYDSSNVLYHNDGTTLVPAPDGGGLADQTFGIGFGSIVAFNDYDLDGFMDLVIAGDGNTLQLYHNEGDGTFKNVSVGSGVVPQFNSKGIGWGDYDNDGLPDLFVARAEQGTSGITGASLYHNNGDGTFEDVTEAAGVAVTGSCWAAVWGDYDNDGYLDVFVTSSGDAGVGPGNANKLFHNNGDGTFTNVAMGNGLALEDGVSLHKGAAWGDYDNDGFLDLIIKDGVGGEEDNGPGALGLHRLFKNNGNANHFLKIILKGTQSNLNGIGARVIVTTATGVIYQQYDGGGGGQYCSQSSQPMHFGLGAATGASVEVHWPSGLVSNFPAVPRTRL
ncbi:MAG: CRTAC1 family protein [Chthoniobacterales bacterium]